MKKRLLFLCLLAACNDTPEYQPAGNALDAMHEFIIATLQGDFKKARVYMIPDADNLQRLEAFEKDYRRTDPVKRREYNEASLEILENAPLNDSVTVINYRNSYDKVAHKVKAVRRQDKWLIDFKYTFNGNL
jgi:hypothetical protein